ncbi:MAG TPA: NAD(P)/FAD-dependent oxidoreductase [Chitinispirillaceae bacterium]|nr:NAD(P)/FAD-dependent oxidoreductase [Chitinispirillaceae bacterium]
MNKQFDIIVVGAGPAGSMAALSAARNGRSVCLLERKPQAGTPVRCGEGIGHRSLVENIDVRPEWIKSVIKRSIMVAPNGLKVEIANVDESYILDREKMDNDIVKDAIDAGVTYYTKFATTGLKRVGEKEYEVYGNDVSLKSNCIILADGVESKLARFVGWNTTLQLKDIETCAFARVISPLIDNETCIFYTGSKVAPGGYAWVFPRGKGEANVGLGILGVNSKAGSALESLNRFINSEFPAARITNTHCGGVPVTKWIRPLVRDGVMLAGDAARQVNCLSGAGIAYSLYAGKHCGQIAARAFSNGSIDYSFLNKYQQVWDKRYGKQQIRSYSLKEFVTKNADDDFLNRIAVSLSKEDPQKMNYLRVFVRTFSRHPVLLFKAFKLFR